MSVIVVYHESYGCDTGCCGHRIERDGLPPEGSWAGGFSFTHPDGEDHLEWAKAWVRDVYGEEHVKDLDWSNCLVLDE